MTKPDKPLRCPFCGQMPFVNKRQNGTWEVRCVNENCGVIVMTDEKISKQLAIKTWSLRIETMTKSNTCAWKMVDSDYNIWETDCGESFVLEDGTPKENKLRYCCFCGRKLIEEK